MLKIVVITAEHQACCDLNLIPQHGQQETRSVSTRRFWRCLERYGKVTGCLQRDNRVIGLIELISTRFGIFVREFKSYECQFVWYREEVVEKLLSWELI